MELYKSTPFSNPVKTENFHVVVKLLNDMGSIDKHRRVKINSKD